jgi:hypothetical protein
VLGDWRVAGADALYDKSDYYFQLGFGFLQADTATLILGDDELPSLEAFDAQMARSQDLLRPEPRLRPPGASTPGRAWLGPRLFRDDPSGRRSRSARVVAVGALQRAEASERVALVSALDDFHGTDWLDDGFQSATAIRIGRARRLRPAIPQALPEDLEFFRMSVRSAWNFA